MTAWQLLAAAVLYAWVAADFARVHIFGMCVAFLAYAVANVAFAWDYLKPFLLQLKQF
jgi:hypothetical protein